VQNRLEMGQCLRIDALVERISTMAPMIGSCLFSMEVQLHHHKIDLPR
jgi:hypothetical protein